MMIDDEHETDAESSEEVDNLEFCSVDDLASRLSVERKTLYEAVSRGEVAGACRIGRVIRIHLPTFMASVCRPGSDEEQA